MPKTQTILLAMCAALPTGVATCAAIPVTEESLDGWKLLIPAGAFKPNDGRPGWMLKNAEAVIAASKLPGLIDFDHGTQLKSDSRAAAWIEELQPRGPNNEPGIWGRIEGTAEGKAALASKAYRFFSPTFNHDAATRVVTKVIGGSLVNNPALDEIPALASQQETAPVEELLAKLRKALGLADTATADDIIAAITAQMNNATATASAKRLGDIATAAGITLASADALTDAHVTAICTKLKAPATGNADQVAILSQQVADLTQRLNASELATASKTAEDKVEEGIKAGKIAPALKADMIALCKSNPAAFDTMMSKAPVVLPGGRIAPQGEVGEALTPEDLALCSQLGITPEQFTATAKARKEAK